MPNRWIFRLFACLLVFTVVAVNLHGCDDDDETDFFTVLIEGGGGVGGGPHLGQIEVFVKDGDTGTPISNAHVWISRFPDGAVITEALTDSGGFVKIGIPGNPVPDRVTVSAAATFLLPDDTTFDNYNLVQTYYQVAAKKIVFVLSNARNTNTQIDGDLDVVTAKQSELTGLVSGIATGGAGSGGYVDTDADYNLTGLLPPPLEVDPIDFDTFDNSSTTLTYRKILRSQQPFIVAALDLDAASVPLNFVFSQQPALLFDERRIVNLPFGGAPAKAGVPAAPPNGTLSFAVGTVYDTFDDTSGVFIYMPDTTGEPIRVGNITNTPAVTDYEVDYFAPGALAEGRVFARIDMSDSVTGATGSAFVANPAGVGPFDVVATLPTATFIEPANALFPTNPVIDGPAAGAGQRPVMFWTPDLGTTFVTIRLEHITDDQGLNSLQQDQYVRWEIYMPTTVVQNLVLPAVPVGFDPNLAGIYDATTRVTGGGTIGTEITGTGSVGINVAGDTVTAFNTTAFTTEVSVGDFVTIAGERRAVVGVTSSQVLDFTGNEFSALVTDQSYTIEADHVNTGKVFGIGTDFFGPEIQTGRPIIIPNGAGGFQLALVSSVASDTVLFIEDTNGDSGGAFGTVGATPFGFLGTTSTSWEVGFITNYSVRTKSVSNLDFDNWTHRSIKLNTTATSNPSRAQFVR